MIKMEKPTFYITTAIHYVNGSPHLGHAYEEILTDVMARFKRLDGYDVRFLTGTDEHGQKVAKTAEERGMEPKQLCDTVSAEFIDMFKKLNISNDDFIRTTEDRHHKASKALWLAIKENNPDDIYLDKYAGWYSVRDEAYFGEDELQTGDDGKKYTQSGSPVQWMEEPCYFFRLSAYASRLLDLYRQRPEFIAPDSRRNEIVAFVERGLEDVSISRTTFKWGIPVPDDSDHVMYVWLDALTNYITALGYPDTQGEFYQKYWPANHHVIGKDITRFHCIYWPAFLMAANLELPKQVFAHGFINVEGRKMSKSVGNVISPQDLLDTLGADQTRYILMRDVPHGQDGNFSQEHAVQRINSDLANGLGNLVQRTLSMIYKNCDMATPEPGMFERPDLDLMKETYACLEDIRGKADKMEFHRVLERIWHVVGEANAYIDTQAPWTLKKTDFERMKTVLYVLAEVIRCLGILVLPFMPESGGKILDQIRIPSDERTFANLCEDDCVKPGRQIEAPQGVFPRLELQSIGD